MGRVPEMGSNQEIEDILEPYRLVSFGMDILFAAQDLKISEDLAEKVEG